jgi:hypothetical protein
MSKVNLNDNLFMHFTIAKLLTGEIVLCLLDFDMFNIQDATHFRHAFVLFPDQSDVDLQFFI